MLKKTNHFYSYRIFYIVLWSLTPLLYYFRIVWMRLPILGKFCDNIIPTIVILAILFAFNSLIRRIRANDFIFCFAVLFVFLLSFVLYPDNEPFLNEYFYPFIVLSLPYYFAGVSINIKMCWNDLYKVSFISIICFGLVKFMLISSNYEFEKDSDMTGAYQLLPHLLLCVWALFQKRSIWRIGIVALGVFLLLGQGNRGSLLSTISFVTLYILLILDSKFKYKLLIGLIGYVLILFYEDINDFLYFTMNEYGMSTRLFSLYIEGDLADSTGRDVMFSDAIDAIKNSPLFGYGITGDRFFSGGLAYIHNCILEILIAFGPILGTFIVVLLLLLLIRGLFISDRFDRSWLLLLICVGFIPLLLSGTFLTSGWFFFMIGFCISIHRTYEYK